MTLPSDLLMEEDERRIQQDTTTTTTALPSDALMAEESRFNASLRQALPVNPDKAAKVAKLSAATGVPVDVVNRNEEAVATQARTQELARLSAYSPVLRRQLSDPQFAKLAHDDAENLSLFERTVQYLKNDAINVPGKNIAAFFAKPPHEMAAGLWGYGVEMPADLASKYVTGPLLGKYDPAVVVANFARGQRHNEESVAKSIDAYWGLSDKESYMATQYYNALGSVWQALATLPAGIGQAVTKATTTLTGGMLSRAFQAGESMPLMPLVPMMMSQGGQTYGKGTDQGLSPAVAAIHATSDAAIEGLTERIGLGRFVHDMKAGDPLWKIMRNQLAVENVGEQVATHLEDLNAWAVLPENRDKSFGDYLADRPSAALDTLVQTSIATVMQTGIMGAASSQSRRERAAGKAQNDAATLKKLFDVAVTDKLRERSPADFAQFVQAAADEQGTSAVFIDAATFAQSAQEAGLDIAATMPETAKQLDEALNMKRDLVIPLGELTAALPGTGLENTLMQHMRTSMDGPTLAETQSAQFAEATQAEVERVMAEHEFTTAQKESAATVERELLTQLTGANRFTNDVNTVKAKVAAQIFTTLGSRLGITPEEAYVRHALNTNAERVGKGPVMDQVGRQSVAQVVGDEVAPELSADNAIESARAYYKANLQNTTVTREGLGEIKFTGKGWRKIRRGLTTDLDKVRLIPAIKAIIENGDYSGRFPVTRDDGIVAFHHFEAPVQLGDRVVSAGVSVAEDANGNLFYNLNRDPAALLARQKQKASGLPELEAQGPKPSEGDSTLEQSIVENADEINLDVDLHQGASNRGLYNLNTRTITLLKNADLSTFFHELGHFYLEVLGDIATQPGAPVEVVGDMQQILDWFGIKGELNEISKGSVDAEPNGVQLDAEHLADFLVGQTSSAQGHRSLSAEALLSMLVRVSRAVNDPKVREAVVAALPVDVVDVLGGQKLAAERALHDPAVFEHRLAVDSAQDIPISVERAETLLTVLRTVASVTAKVPVVSDVGGVTKLDGSAAGTGDGGQGGTSSFIGQQNRTSIDVWNAMTLEEKRPYHEQLARGFEAYLFEGSAPSTGLAGVFSRIRAWMIHVYKNLLGEERASTKFQEGLAKAANQEVRYLSDEVRGVFDRMLATNDQILDAEAARAYAPLFASAEQMGATPEEWAAYQEQGQEATQTAVDELQTRSLRDMKWVFNARSRVIRALQKDAAAKRREVRIEARREILSDPVYQAWQFLTRRLSPEDKLPPEAKRSNTDTIDESRDSLFAAIAKLGGLDRAQVISTWGTDPADKPASGLFGKPVWRKTDGRGINDMAEALSQYGYLTLDEHGKIDLAEFEEKFTAEVRGEPQYSNYYDYSAGQSRPGDQIANPQALAAGRFDAFALRNSEVIAPEVTERLQALGMVASDGLHPDIVADLFGFTSADELTRKVVNATPPAEAIEGLTDQRMLERYGDLSSPEAIEQAANEAIHNEVRAKFIATELRALAKTTGKANLLARAAKEFAATIIARKKIREIHPAQYAAAEARAAKAALTALQPVAPSGKNEDGKRTDPGRKSGNLVEAATEKRNQLVNHYAARAAYDALDSVEKGVAYLRRVADSDTIDADYREQIATLLDRFELRKITNKEAAKRASLAEWIEDQRAQGFEPVIDAELLNEARRTPYREMTVEEFRGLVDAVKNIEHLGRLKHKLLTLADQREFAAVVDEAVTSIEDNAKRTIKAPLEQTKWVKAKAGVSEFFAMHRKFSFIAREMDGHVDNGTLWNLLVRPMNDAGNREAVMREEATIALQKLLAPVSKMTEKMFIPEIGASLTRQGRIMVALNTGTAGNLQRLMDGDHWSVQQVQAITNTLTKAEMDFVQSVWDFVGGYRSQIGEQQRRITGVAPEWVEPRTVTTVHGEYRGGYIPAKYDTTRSTRSLADEAAAGVMDQWRAKRGAAKTRDSFTKARADKVVDRPLRKDFGVITQHVTEVTHRLAWQEYLMDAQRLLRASAIDNAIREHYGPETLKAMRDAIEDIAAGEVPAQNAFERGVNYLRTGATIAGLGWRITTSLLQPFGLTQSMVRIGPKYVARGLVEWLGDAARMENTAKRIFDKSDFMRLRAKTMQREISEIRNIVSDRNSAIEASYFYLIQKMQLVADIPTWLGQYHKAVEHGADEDGAVAQADQAVLDAQGGGQIKDLAGIQRGGPLRKLFTNFYSFFNTTYNNTGDAYGRTNFKSPMSVGLFLVDLMLLYSVPAAMGTLLKAALHSGDDGADDEKKLVRQLISDQLTYLFGTMVGLREIAGGIQSAAGLPGDYQGPASVRLFAELTKLGKQAGQGEIDEAFAKAFANTVGILFHLPSGQVTATIDGIVTMANGKTANPGALLVGSNKK